MPKPNLGPPATQIGGYIPYIDFPCERYVGESIGWIIFLSTSGPLFCKFIPWLCCPIPFEFNNTIAFSSDINCDEIGARYGATLFWTMQAISIWGLLLALANVVRCGVLTTIGNVNVTAVNDTISFNEDQEIEVLLFVNEKLSEDDFFQVPKDFEIGETLAKESENEIEDELLEATSLGNVSEARTNRIRRQSGFLGISIPTLDPLYRGADDKSDGCERDEILHVDGECHQILSQGPCEDTEFVLMEPQTKKGYCAPRLCNADRVFVFGDQLCHDPFENDICPPGRQLFTSSLGTPVCGCPYGTYEEEEDLDEDVCQPVLGKLESCAPGHVFWFTSFRREPDCIPDPCKGLNANKGINELAYVPSIFDGKCYQLGQELPQCPDDTFYTLSYSSLKGICASLEEAGYTVLDEEMLESFSRLYGSRLPRDISSSSSSSSSSSNKRKPEIPDVGSSAVLPSFNHESSLLPMKIGQSASPSSKSEDSENSSSDVQVLTTHATAFSPRALSFRALSHAAKLFPHFFPRPSAEKAEREEAEDREGHDANGNRRRRSILPHASPETVFQSSFAACRAGAKMGLNFKCNTKYLPNRLPLSRPKREIPPLSPYPSCPKGHLYTIKRTCVSRESKVKDSMIAFGLG